MTQFACRRFPEEITGMKKAECDVHCNRLLGLAGLDDEIHRIGFSRGMKHRPGIAQVLLGSPKLLVCDKTTSALDPVSRKKNPDIPLVVRARPTVLFSVHILSDAECICTDVAFKTIEFFLKIGYTIPVSVTTKILIVRILRII